MHFGEMQAGPHVGGLTARTNIGAAKTGRLGGNMHIGGVDGSDHLNRLDGSLHLGGIDSGDHPGRALGNNGVAGSMTDHHVGAISRLHRHALNDFDIGDSDCFDWQQQHPAKPLPPTCG